ncbi:MAG: twin-arginine translocation signal domain-containing protein [Burkholderiales bacterium]|nr:MAG: twin-arginine translocation signal domain-containing protein [Burkholderiales bacterium]
MNNNSSPIGTSRRSFIKRSVVAAVAVSSMTVFSGLVRATNGSDACYGICNSSRTGKADGVLNSTCTKKDGSECTCKYSVQNDGWECQS